MPPSQAPIPAEPGDSAPRRNRRQEQAEARKAQLLDAAQAVFAEKGFAAATTRDIARRAGIAEGLIYHYFPGKEALLQALMERATIGPDIAAILERQRGVPIRRALNSLGLGILGVLEKNGAYVRMIVSEAIRNDEVAERLGHLMSRNLGVAQRFFADRVTTGELRPHDTTVVMRVLQANLLWYFVLGSRLPISPAMAPDVFMERMTDMVLHGLLNEEAQPERPADPDGGTGDE